MAVSPGDQVFGEVDAKGGSVTLRLEDLTTGAEFVETFTVGGIGTRSAEWIAEAPAAVSGRNATVLPMTDFGKVTFTGATASSVHDVTGPIATPAWRWTPIDFHSGPGDDPGAQFLDSLSAAKGLPGKLAGGGTAFSITWKPGRGTTKTKQKKPTAPEMVA